MSNITLSVQDDVIRKVRKIAIDKNTTLAAMVREFLERVAVMDAVERDRSVLNLEQSFEKLERNIGGVSWTRDELHER